MREAKIPLQIDLEEALTLARYYLDRIAPTSGNPKFIAGISGGVDSALLATLVVRLYGSGALRGYHLYDRDSAPYLTRAAIALAEQLGIELIRFSIEPHMQMQGIYRSIHMRITDRYAALNRILYQIYRFLAGETPFMTSLRIGSDTLSSSDRRYRLYKSMCAVPEQTFNARHIYRRQILERESSLYNAVVLGAANRSEWNLGWFVKGGVDDVPYQPLIGLYKTQVKQLGVGLGLSDALIAQTPTPDMRKGITDEFAIGIPYENVDLILDYMEGGLTFDDLQGKGIRSASISRVRAMQQFSFWKRGEERREFPIDGGPTGGLRIDLKIE